MFDGPAMPRSFRWWPQRSGQMRLLLLVERSREPVEALVEAVARGRAGRLDVPVALAQRVEAELVGHLRDGHGVRQILCANRAPKP